MSTVAKKRYTVEEYLAIERASEVKHEFFDGEMFAMAGATATHTRIVSNLVRQLGNRLPDCDVFPNDMRVLCPTGLRTYPDVTVVCGPLEFEDEREDTLLNPQVIVEVLSPSTAAYDRGRKFVNYKSIPSLQQYVVVEQSESLVDCYVRRTTADSHEWVVVSSTDLEDELHLPSFDVRVPLSEIYSRVEFPEPESNGQPAADL